MAQLSLRSGLLLAVPNPSGAEGAVVESAIQAALLAADAAGIRGRDITPFLLKVGSNPPASCLPIVDAFAFLHVEGERVHKGSVSGGERVSDPGKRQGWRTDGERSCTSACIIFQADVSSDVCTTDVSGAV